MISGGYGEILGTVHANTHANGMYRDRGKEVCEESSKMGK